MIGLARQWNVTAMRRRGIAFALFGALAAILAIQAAAAESATAAGTVSVSVVGQGSVTGDGVNCNQSGGPDCSEFYDDVTYQDCDPERKPPCINITEQPFVQFTAGPDSNGFLFQQWEGCDSSSNRTCSLSVTENTALTARYRDAAAPSMSGLSPASGVRAGQIDLAVNASDNAGVARVEFRVRGALVATDLAAPFGTTFDTTTVADGPATLRATAFDAAGNSASVETTQVTFDNTAPSLAVTSGPDGQTFAPGSTQTWSFTASDTTLASVQCSLVTEAAAPSFNSCSGGSTSHSATGLASGTYTFTVRARDGLDRVTAATRTFTIDGVAPETSITGGPANGTSSTATSATFTFGSSESDSTFECRVYPAALTPGAFGPCTDAGSHTASGFSPGTYAFEVRATDGFGNVDGSPAKRTFTVTTATTGGGNGGGNGGTGGTGGSTTVTPAVITEVLKQILNPSLSTDFDAFKGYTRYKRLVVKGVPAGATVSVTCKGKKCPAKSFKKTRAGNVKLAKFLKKKLRVGTTLTIRVTRAGAIGKQFVIKIRRGKAPRLKITQIV